MRNFDNSPPNFASLEGLRAGLDDEAIRYAGRYADVTESILLTLARRAGGNTELRDKVGDLLGALASEVNFGDPDCVLLSPEQANLTAAVTSATSHVQGSIR